VDQTLLLNDDTFVAEYADAARYDLEYGATHIDGPFYRSLLSQPGTVLDLATGTGRVALLLAADGHQVVGVDAAPAMVARAETKAAELLDESAEGSATFLVDDATALNLRRKFDLVTMSGNALQAFLTDTDRAAVLNSVWRHLKPGGRFAFAVRFPQAAELAARLDVAAPWFTYVDFEGRDVYVSGTQHYHPVAQVVHHVTHRVFADGTPVTAPTHVAVRYSFPQELETALGAARLDVVERFGDFDGSALGEGSPAMVYVCRRAAKG
jgi:ubiquinone/menaquinone biosynthesis C-methylase UbiE